MIRRPPRSTQSRSSAASDVYKRQDLAGANLVLFGTPRTNRLIARFAPQFPLTLNPGAADYGLLFIVAAGRHYVLVSSGLPWWTGAEEANRGGYRYAPAPYRLLSTFGDYIPVSYTHLRAHET